MKHCRSSVQTKKLNTCRTALYCTVSSSCLTPDGARRNCTSSSSQRRSAELNKHLRARTQPRCSIIAPPARATMSRPATTLLPSALPPPPPIVPPAETYYLWARRDTGFSSTLRLTHTRPRNTTNTITTPAASRQLPPHCPPSHARADSSVLGLHNPPRIMARAYIASSSSSTTTTTTCLLGSIREQSPPPPTPYNISSPIGKPFYPRASDYGGYSLKRLSMPIELAIVPRAHWLSRLRSCLRLLIIVLSGAVVCMLTHTIEIYRGNRYIDLRKGELPMIWPAHTNLAPTIILFAVAAGNFLASVAILSLSFKRSFRRPFRSRDMYRIVAGIFGVIMWITALVVFNLLDRASKASLGRYSCTNQNVMSNGRYQYRAVCEEQVCEEERRARGMQV